MAAESGGAGGSLGSKFAAANGIKGPVSASYVGRDSHGNPVYKFTWYTQGGGGKGGRLGRITNTRSMAYVGGKFYRPGSAAANPNPITPGVDPSRGSGSSPGREELIERSIAKLGDLVSRGLITSDQARSYNFSTWSDTALRMWISRAGTGNRVSPSVIEATPSEAEGLLGDVFTDLGGGGGGFGGGGGGGGGGIVAPGYKEPDRRVVEDFVKGNLVSLVGGVPDHLVGPGVETFMRDHRAAFDVDVAMSMNPGRDGKEIDPQQSVLEYIRGTQEYQTIHELRPKSVDERTWVSDRAQQAIQGGIANVRQEDFAITQATAGADIQDVAEAAATAEFQATGQAPTLLENQFRQVAQAMFSRVAR